MCALPIFQLCFVAGGCHRIVYPTADAGCQILKRGDNNTDGAFQQSGIQLYTAGNHGNQNQNGDARTNDAFFMF